MVVSAAGWLQDIKEREGLVDLKKHVWAYKLQREMWRRMPMFRGELKGNHPNFPEGSKAAIVEVSVLGIRTFSSEIQANSTRQSVVCRWSNCIWR